MHCDHAQLRILLFGPPTFLKGDQQVRPGIASSTLETLAFLLSNHGRQVSRDTLLDTLWQGRDDARARSALNTTTWRIKNASALAPYIALETSDITISLVCRPGVRLDLYDLEQAVDAAHKLCESGNDLLPLDVRDALVNAVESYTTRFMPTLDSSWVIVERERCRTLYIRGLLMLMHDAAARCDYEAAINWGQKILAKDPYREITQREVMWLYVMNGQRCDALRHYKRYVDTLKREIGLEPLKDTEMLYNLVRKDASCGAPNIKDFRKNRRGLSPQSFAGYLTATNFNRKSIYMSLRSETPAGLSK